MAKVTIIIEDKDSGDGRTIVSVQAGFKPNPLSPDEEYLSPAQRTAFIALKRISEVAHIADPHVRMGLGDEKGNIIPISEEENNRLLSLGSLEDDEEGDSFKGNLN